MNIALIGMMGSGKTTISKLLVDKISEFSFVDTDLIIVERENMTINDIFSLKGEDYFRSVETKVLEDVLSNDNQVVSTGGGIVKKEQNILLLKEKSIVVYLEASSDVLFERVKNNKERPLLNVSDMKNKIETILSERISLYQKAHITVNTENKTPDIIVSEILKELKNYAKS